jgi:hypothetical protein
LIVEGTLPPYVAQVQWLRVQTDVAVPRYIWVRFTA